MLFSDDVLAHARTGSGKTASFMLPIVKLIQERRNRERMGVNPNSPLALIIAPTKELVSQLGDEARRFTHGSFQLCLMVFGILILKK